MAIIDEQLYNYLLGQTSPMLALKSPLGAYGAQLVQHSYKPNLAHKQWLGKINRELAHIWYFHLEPERRDFWHRSAWHPPEHETIYPYPRRMTLPAWIGFRDFRYSEYVLDPQATWMPPDFDYDSGIEARCVSVDDRIEVATIEAHVENAGLRPPTCGVVICECHPRGYPTKSWPYHYTLIHMEQLFPVEYPNEKFFEIPIHHRWKPGSTIYWIVRPRFGFRLGGWHVMSYNLP